MDYEEYLKQIKSAYDEIREFSSDKKYHPIVLAAAHGKSFLSILFLAGLSYKEFCQQIDFLKKDFKTALEKKDEP